MTDDSEETFPVFAASGPSEQLWHGQRCPLFDVVHPAFPVPTMASPTLQAAVKDGFGEAVMACDMPEPCMFPSLDSCQKTHKEVDLVSHPVVGPVLQVGDAEKFPQALVFEGLNPFPRVSKQDLCFTAIDEDGGDKRLV